MKRILITLMAVLFASNALAVELGDDGLHKTEWMRETFKDLAEDLAEANAEGKRLAIIFEQRGCIYCTKMHEDVFPDPQIDAYIKENYFFIQLNLFGDLEVTDFDGETLSEKNMAAKWGILFTPTIMFMPEEVPADQSAKQTASVEMPGAFGVYTTFNMLNWVVEHGYDGDENFQKYHARRLVDQLASE